jgi:hypothetical protein
MAIQIQNFISGRLGNVVFYERQGKYIARSLPSRVRLSKNTKKRNGNFGVASSTGSRLRQGLESVLPFPRELTAQRRFSGAISIWLGQRSLSELTSSDKLHPINQFDFVEESGFANRFRVPITITPSGKNALELKMGAYIPKTEIAAPIKTVSVQVTFGLTACTLKQALTQPPQIVRFEIPFTAEVQPSRTIVLPFKPMSDLLIVTVGSIIYTQEGNKTCQRRNYLPCSVIDARYIK